MNDHVTSIIENFTADERLRALHALLRTLPPSAIREAIADLESEDRINYGGSLMASKIGALLASNSVRHVWRPHVRVILRNSGY